MALPVSGPTLEENPAQWETVARLRPEASLRHRNMAAVAATLSRADGAASPVHGVNCALRFPLEVVVGRSALPPLGHLS